MEAKGWSGTLNMLSGHTPLLPPTPKQTSFCPHCTISKLIPGVALRSFTAQFLPAGNEVCNLYAILWLNDLPMLFLISCDDGTFTGTDAEAENLILQPTIKELTYWKRP